MANINPNPNPNPNPDSVLHRCQSLFDWGIESPTVLYILSSLAGLVACLTLPNKTHGLLFVTCNGLINGVLSIRADDIRKSEFIRKDHEWYVRGAARLLFLGVFALCNIWWGCGGNEREDMIVYLCVMISIFCAVNIIGPLSGYRVVSVAAHLPVRKMYLLNRNDWWAALLTFGVVLSLILTNEYAASLRQERERLAQIKKGN